VRGCRIEGTQLKAQLVNRFSGMNFPWVDQNYPAWQGKMLCFVVRKGLSALLDQTDYIIVMTMAWIGVFNVISVQQPNIEFGMMPNL